MSQASNHESGYMLGFFNTNFRKEVTNNMEKEVLTLKDCSIILDLSMPSIYALIKNDPTFPVMKLNKKLTVSKKLLDEWIQNKTKYKN